MKEIKAYVRRDRVNAAVRELERMGAPGITLVEVHPVGYGYEPNYFEPEFADPLKRYQQVNVTKLEIVCADSDANHFVEAIRTACGTGTKGDGMIFVAEVSRAIRIRDGATGEQLVRGK